MIGRGVTASPLTALKTVPCFAALDPDATAWLARRVRERCFDKGEIVILEGEPCPGLFVVKTGSVKLYRSSPHGEEQIVRLVHDAGCFECAPLFDKGPNPVSAQALERSEIYFIPASDFEILVNSHPKVVLQIVPILAMRLRALLHTVEGFSFKQVYSRLARLLYQLSSWQGDSLVVSPEQLLNQQQLACMLGCSRQALNTALRKLVKDGTIKMDGRRIIVLKPDVLGAK